MVTLRSGWLPPHIAACGYGYSFLKRPLRFSGSDYICANNGVEGAESESRNRIRLMEVGVPSASVFQPADEKVEDAYASRDRSRMTIPIHLTHGQNTVFALDIGGTLIKAVYIEEFSKENQKAHLKLLTFPSTCIDEALASIQHRVIQKANGTPLRGVACGTQCHKYKQKITDTLNVQMDFIDEMDALGRGFHIGLTQMAHEDFLYDPISEASSMPKLPALLCIIGSGTIIIRVHEDGRYEYVTSSTRGGLYFYALGKLLTKAESYDELIRLAERGNAQHLTDTTAAVLKEKYPGADYEKCKKLSIELYPFGKIITEGITDPAPEDTARALLHAVVEETMCLSLRQCRVAGISTMYFAGSFVDSNAPCMDYLKRMPNYSLRGTRPSYPVFVKQGSHLGAFGALLVGLDKSSRQASEAAADT